MYHLILKTFYAKVFIPTLAHHNHDKFEIFAFAELENEDKDFSGI